MQTPFQARGQGYIKISRCKSVYYVPFTLLCIYLILDPLRDLKPKYFAKLVPTCLPIMSFQPKLFVARIIRRAYIGSSSIMTSSRS